MKNTITNFCIIHHYFETGYVLEHAGEFYYCYIPGNIGEEKTTVYASFKWYDFHGFRVIDKATYEVVNTEYAAVLIAANGSYNPQKIIA